jgi:Yip1 domain
VGSVSPHGCGLKRNGVHSGTKDRLPQDYGEPDAGAAQNPRAPGEPAPAQREQQLEQGAKVTQIISYVFPVITLLIWLIIAAVLFATFKVAVGADVSFKVSLAIVVYSALPIMLKTLLAAVSLLAGMSPDSFSFRNPLATNPGYFMNAADNVFLYSVASAVDIFVIWTLVLTAMGFTCVSKIKTGTAYAVVFGWWIVFTLAGAAIGAAFS